jgi:SH3-like domain-containing protein
MAVNRLILWIIMILTGLLAPHSSFAEAEFVAIIGDHVNIRTGPTTSSQVVAKARRGDVFELLGKKGKWYRIRMFSPNYRYVHRSLGRKISYTPSTPDQPSIRRDIFKALLKAENTAEVKADQKYPVQDKDGAPLSGHVQKNLELMWLLMDRYKLESMHRFKVQSPIHDSILEEGIKNSW